MILENEPGAVLYALKVAQHPFHDALGCDWFVISIDADKSYEILTRINLFETSRSKDPETLELIFSDTSGRFATEDDLYAGGFAPPVELDHCRMVVRRDEVLWQASHPEAEVELTTESLGLDELREIAGRRLVRLD